MYVSCTFDGRHRDKGPSTVKKRGKETGASGRRCGSACFRDSFHELPQLFLPLPYAEAFSPPLTSGDGMGDGERHLVSRMMMPTAVEITCIRIGEKCHHCQFGCSTREKQNVRGASRMTPINVRSDTSTRSYASLCQVYTPKCIIRIK
jgi:hypothetical protein